MCQDNFTKKKEMKLGLFITESYLNHEFADEKNSI